MYLGVVREYKLSDESCKASNTAQLKFDFYADFCNQNGELETICLDNYFNLIANNGLLVSLDYVDGYWVPSLVLGKNEVKNLSIRHLLQLDKLIELEKSKLEEVKREFKRNELASVNLHLEIIKREKLLHRLSLIMDTGLNTAKKRFMFTNLKESLKQNGIQKQYRNLIEKIIFNLKSKEIGQFEWMMYANAILNLSNNDIDEELLSMAIELLLNVKISNNETNELKLQLEQQLKEKLNELKGKQKKLV